MLEATSNRRAMTFKELHKARKIAVGQLTHLTHGGGARIDGDLVLK
jgi:hypothetical protein